MRETFEEAGVVGELLDDEPLAEVSYKSQKKGFACRVTFYGMQVAQILESWPEVGDRERRVVPLEDAVQMVSKQYMKDALVAASKYL